MTKSALLPAFLTGAFCAVFAVVVGSISMIVSVVPGILIAFVSGFLGSLFATYVLKRDRS